MLIHTEWALGNRPVLTYGLEGVLELEGEGGQGHLVGRRQDGDGGQVGSRVPCVPFTGRSLEARAVSCVVQEMMRQGKHMLYQ